MKQFWKLFIGNLLVILVVAPVLVVLILGPAVGITQLFIGEDGNVETTGLVLSGCFALVAVCSLEALSVTIRERKNKHVG